MDEDQRLSSILQVVNLVLEDGSQEQKLQVYLMISNLAINSKTEAIVIANHTSLFKKINGEKGCLSEDLLISTEAFWCIMEICKHIKDASVDQKETQVNT